MAKKIVDVGMFVSGDPNNEYPNRVLVTYRISVGDAKSEERSFDLSGVALSTVTVQGLHGLAMSEINTRENGEEVSE